MKNDVTVGQILNSVVATLTEFSKHQSNLLDQTHRTVARNMTNFIKTDLVPLKETKKHFDKISDDLDNILNRNSQVSRAKSNEADEVANLLTATRSCFQHTALDYVNQLSCVQSKKRHELVDSCVSLLQAHEDYFVSGVAAAQEFNRFVKCTEKELQVMRDESVSMSKQLNAHHAMVSEKETLPAIVLGDDVQIAGHLFKRTSKTFKSWHRRWFMVRDHQLVYQKRQDVENERTVMEMDLRLCSVKPLVEFDRRFCFEIVSPSK